MSSKDSCCNNSSNVESNESKCFEDGGAELRADGPGKCCGTACAVSAVEEQCSQVARPGSEASLSVRCCVNKACSDNVVGNFIQEEESDCEKQKVSSVVDGGEKGEICSGKMQGFDSCCDRDIGGLDSCCGGNEKVGVCNGDDSEVQISENCLNSCCSEQTTKVEVNRDGATDTGLNDNDKIGVDLGSCCERTGTGTCSADSAAKEDASGETGDCCSSTRSCGATLQDGRNVLSERDANEHEAEFIEASCETSDCCDKEYATDSSNMERCEKKGLLRKQNKTKRDTVVSPAQPSSRMGNYGSTAISTSKSESDSFLTIRAFKYTAVPGSSNDDSDITAEDAKVICVLEPSMQKTKFRIQNICCGKEADMVSRELEPLNGITAVSVNVVGRVAFVHHDSNIITAPDIVSILNKLHLGVSIMESSNHDDERALRKEVIIRLAGKCAVLAVVTLLFIAVIVGRSLEYGWLKWLAIAEIVIGAIPIIRKIIINILKKVYIDINMLMMIAVIGTIVLQEWIEGATLVFVFAIAEVLQQYCVYKVQSAISGEFLLFQLLCFVAVSKKVGNLLIDLSFDFIICLNDKELRRTKKENNYNCLIEAKNETLNKNN